MRNHTACRATALVSSAATFGVLFIAGSWRSDNAFLIPDLLLCGLLVLAAFLPDTRAMPALLFTFGIAAGVFMVATAQRIVDAEPFVPAFVGVVLALFGASLAFSAVSERHATAPSDDVEVA
ncbi:hypothetical protein [Nocardia brasiliensis]|uniref:hypothetical protein n=1 Tax=Nocardia brasiliensis TaxID=37326 RepID=UPI002456C41D|nr:hypothetical protein [Nocardia brasiliensis]